MANELLSLFCGSGGLDHGFHHAGFETVLALDKSPDAVKTFNLNIGSQIAQVADLSSLLADQFLEKIPLGSHPVGLIGGPPCQGFSRGNNHAHVDDPRNQLPLIFAEMLSVANRKFDLHFFAFENVVDISKPKHADNFKMILSKLRLAGFNLFTQELNSYHYSVPQKRIRLFIIGINATRYPQMAFQFPDETEERRTVFDTIGGLPEPCFYNRNLTPDTIPYHPNHWTMVPKSEKFSTEQTGQGRSFRRLDWGKPSPTIAYGNREIHIHPSGKRRLSLLEAMLLQGFSPEYVLTGTLSSQVTQVSNAVPPPVAEAVARSIRMQLNL